MGGGDGPARSQVQRRALGFSPRVILSSLGCMVSGLGLNAAGVLMRSVDGPVWNALGFSPRGICYGLGCMVSGLRLNAAGRCMGCGIALPGAMPGLE